MKVVDGELVQGDRITAASSGESYDVLEVTKFCCLPLMMAVTIGHKQAKLIFEAFGSQ